MALTAKQEAFALAVAAGMNQSDAYRSAYDAQGMKSSSINVNASKLMADAKVAQRVTSLRRSVLATAIEEAKYGWKEAMAEAAEALAVSKAKENGGAMVAAVTLRAKLSGLIVEKRETKHGRLDGVPIEELEAMDAAIEAIMHARTADRPSARSKTS